MTVQNRSELGKRRRACERILSKSIFHSGYELASRHLEVDIIQENSDCIVFCEVKTRSSTLLGTPEEFVTRQKNNISFERRITISFSKI